MSEQGDIQILEKKQLEQAKNIHNQGNEYFDKGMYDEALNCYQTSLDCRILVVGEYHLNVADTYNNIGNTYYYKGLYDKALEHHFSSARIKTQLLGEDDIELAITYNGIGICYDAQGFYSKALAYYNKSLDLRMKYLGAEHPSIAQSLNNLGLCYYSKGAYDDALIYLEKALDIRQQHFGAEHWSVAQTFLNIGVCYFSKNDYDKALQFYQKSLKLKKAIYGKNHLNIASVLDNIGFCYRRKKMPEIALRYHYQVLEIRQKTLAEDHPSLAITFNNIANCLMNKGFFEGALTYFQQALQIVIPEFSPQTNLENPPIQQYMDAHILLEILQSKAACFQEMFLAKRQNEEADFGALALKTYELAAELTAKLRRGYKAESTHLTLAEKAHQMHESAIKAAIENEAIDWAFTFAEQGKGMVLLSSFKDIDARLAANIPEKWLDEANNLRAILTELDNAISRERNKVEAKRNREYLRRCRNQHFDYQRKYENLIERLEHEYPHYYQLKYDVHNTTIHQLQEVLDEKTAILEFFVGSEQSFLFVITKNTQKVHCIDLSEKELKEVVEDLIEAIYAENNREYLQLAHTLYEKLLKESLNEPLFDSITKLHILPDGDLNFLPFEVLLTDEQPSKAYRDISYLLNKYVITYHYSSTLWYYGKSKQSASRASEFSFAGFAPVYQDFKSKFEILSYSVSEIEGIQEAFAAKGYESNTFIHAAASKKQFRQQAANYKYVHIAAHAFSGSKIGEEMYASEGILFSSDLNSNSNLDGLEGILSMSEIYNFSLKADLVVLSCCDSGVGKVAKGEGVMAINRGFLYAGAKNVIYTLFKIYDQHSAELMQYLYEEILKKNAYNQSLRTSKLKMIRQNYAPKYWSGFVLIGD